MMLAPSSKDFFYMLEFCLRRIDPSFSFKDPKKPEEETPAIFKALKYPFGMSARALASVGTPHAWPNFLACLHWLIELLNYDDFAQLHRDELLIEDRTSQEALRYSFFNFIGQAYQAFMSFDDRETQLEADFVRTLLDRNNERQEATSRLQEHTQQIQEETVRLRNQDSRVHNLTRAVETSEFDLEKLKAEVMKLKEANEATTARLVEVKAKGSAQRESVERLQHELAQLDHILHHQAERGWDAEKMSTQKQEVKQTIVTVIHLRDEVEQASNTIEMEISEKFREVEKGVSTLNGLLDLTGLVKTLGGEVRVLPQSPSILSADIKESVKPVLSAFLEQQRRIHMQNQPLLVEMQAKAEERQEEVAAKRTGLAELKARVDRELAHFNELRESFQQPRKALEQEIVELEKDIGAIALASKDSLATRRKERSDIVMRLEDKRAAFEKEELELNDILNRYIDWIVTHQETIAAKFTALETSLARQIDQN
jgi:kinetochore protein NDC80